MKWLTFSNHIFKWILLNKYVFDSNVIDIFSCDQAALWMVPSVCLSVCPSVCPSVRPSVCHTFLTMFPSLYHYEIFRSYYQWQKWSPCKRSRSEVKSQGHRGQHPTTPNISGSWLQFEFTYDDEMMHRAWCFLEEVRYCFSRSSVKFQGLKAKNIVDFDLNWTFLDCNSSFNSLMAMKWCTKLDAT